MSKKSCWVLSDNLIGHEKQSISLAEKLNINYKIIKTEKLNFIERNLLTFLNLKKTKFLKIDEKLMRRSVNFGFSGGEKKRSEILQMTILEPKLTIMDETDSGLDIDALKIVAHGVNNFKNSERSFLIITHYQRLLNYITPDKVHILADGKIVKTGDKTLALELEEKGYENLIRKHG